MHPRRVIPQKKWLSGVCGTLKEIDRSGSDLVVNGFHPFFGERTSIFEFSIRARSDHAARSEFLTEFGGFWIIRVLRFFLCIEVVQISEELVETMVSW